MWYAIIFNKSGIQIFKSPNFPTSQQATFWAESHLRGNEGARYQLFKV